MAAPRGHHLNVRVVQQCRGRAFATQRVGGPAEYDERVKTIRFFVAFYSSCFFLLSFFMLFTLSSFPLVK